MALSEAAAREIAKVLRKHVAPRTLDEIAAELVEICGDKDFREARPRAGDDPWPINALAIDSQPRKQRERD